MALMIMANTHTAKSSHLYTGDAEYKQNYLTLAYVGL